MHTLCGLVFQPLAPSVKILKVPLHSRHVASFALSVGDGVGVPVDAGVFFWRRNVDTADRVDDGRAFRAISLFSTRAITSLIGVLRMS